MNTKFGILVTLIILLVIVVGGGLYFLTGDDVDESIDPVSDQETISTTTDQTTDERESVEVIGQSVEGNDITAYHYGEGETELLFIGGIHGGYSWNTALVAYELMDYLEANPDEIPENVTVTVIPVMNPDGLEEVVGTTGRFDEEEVPETVRATVAGRFNANDVDLNRNFDCDWQPESTWQDRTVSGGDEAFSEPEAEAIRDYVNANDPEVAVVWYSAAGGVFASSCHNDVLPETTAITNLYAQASGYEAYETFDFYDITGDMVNWLAKEDIPAISVLLSTHDDVEWSENRAGVEALLEFYGQEEEDNQ